MMQRLRQNSFFTPIFAQNHAYREYLFMVRSLDKPVIVIGGGLSGCEAAWQLAQQDIPTILYEMRPSVATAAHKTDHLAELVCSNSLGSDLINRASGLLKQELRKLGSIIIEVADLHRLPAGSALAVDRIGFSAEITARIKAHPNITLIRDEIQRIPSTGIVIIASGPLTSDALSTDIQRFTGNTNLFFYDAIAPIVDICSIDMQIAFRASRYEKDTSEQGDYINCPMNELEYHKFVSALINAEKIVLKAYETEPNTFFEGCLPVEVLAARGENALAFGPLRPVGLRDPRTNKRPFAVVQLRQDNAAASLYNLVGFQTNLKYNEQRRVFRMIPGLENANFVRFGSMHRNTYINAPKLLKPTLQAIQRDDLFFCGQIAGLEGYAGNVAGGWVAGYNAACIAQGKPPSILPHETMIGAMMYYITHADPKSFQPMKANFGLVPVLEGRIKGKRARGEFYASRALHALDAWFPTHNLA
jgi:methylenetetrahydrofolate--tRNA-(uracil-5-)-methyltransferase